MRQGTVIVLLLAACAGGAEAPVEDADAPADPPGSVDGVADEEPVDTAEEPDDTALPVVERIAWRGLSCPVEGPSGWDAANPCGPELPDCDLVVFEALCELAPGATLEACLARGKDGAWQDCSQAWASRLSWSDRDEVLSNPEVVGEALHRTYGHPVWVPSGFDPAVSACEDRLRRRTPPPTELTAFGVYFPLGPVDHQACAHPRMPGVWGGGQEVGHVRSAVRSDCVDDLRAAGWNVVIEADGPWVVTTSFSMRRVLSGRVADLGRP